MPPTKRDESDETMENEEIWKALRNEILAAIRSNDPKTNLKLAIEKASKLKDLFNLQFRDEHGYSLLGHAIKLHLMDVIKASVSFSLDVCLFSR